MTRAATPTSPPAEILGSLGSLREALAALRNLEHLLGSVQVGPKVLAQVLPELEASAAGWSREASRLLAYFRERSEGEAEITEFDDFTRRSFADFSRVLARSRASTASAKTRLTLERDVRRLVPLFASAFDHLELLVDATWAPELPLNLRELLVSRPELGGDKPDRPLPLVGEAERIEVNLPARVALRALGLLVSRVGERTGLRVELRGEICVVSLEPNLESTTLAHVPALLALPGTKLVTRAALGRYGVRVPGDARTLEIPLSDGCLAANRLSL